MAALFISFPAPALDRAALEKLAHGENDPKIEAIGALVAEADPRAIDVLAKFAAGEVEIDGKKSEVVVNNRLRGAVNDALAALRLLSPERATRFAAAKELAAGADPSMLPLVNRALEKEADPDIRSLLELVDSPRVPMAARRATPTRTSASRRRRACARWRGGSPGASGQDCCSQACR